MIRREGARMALSGPVTLANVEEVLEEGRRQLQDGVERIDLSGVTEMDSALLALLLAWLREAKGRSLVLENQPAALRTIARLYGVESLLDGHAANGHS
jgi:phospholipid transport system transporter-binding protein